MAGDDFACRSNVGVAPQEQLLGIKPGSRHLSIGLPAEHNGGEKRFPLTPEGVALLTREGFAVLIERGAGEGIKYSDLHYTEAGAQAVEPAEVFRCDVVLKITPLNEEEAASIRPSGLLLTLLQPQYQSASVLKVLMQKRVTAVAIDRVVDDKGRYLFADILDEIDGRAAIVLASELLSNRSGGKGVLLGGVPGVAAAEVLIIGGGLAGRAAARAASGLGALVRIFDNDFYRLRATQLEVGPSVFTSNMHPHVLENAMRSADVVIGTEVPDRGRLGMNYVEMMKRGALLFDLCMDQGGCFETSSCSEAPCNKVYEQCGVLHYCLSSVGSAVARTASMALSNLLVPLLMELNDPAMLYGHIKTDDRLRNAVYLFGGKLTHKELSLRLGLPYYDMALFMSMF
ncbi:alanine dehydrogenase [Barnesiella viscericola]|uniref:alanine dehydrogenase n=1 Tax=Barnesiella viscericola TaxID=397865 RepID=UPI00235594B8|nr:alanine dehydrogenase [Barnesiella viscericola]